ncbi:cytochrome b561 domain-containing protein [Amphibiibacter pelophylacis]|uniref:Cytochrome b561 domain-containing protein n=1 Tax=Amphibiibacter pelophylacis TaxID=1799477 RepID=A0ACC6P5T1_9BURK
MDSFKTLPAALVSWLLLPLSGLSDHALDPAVYWHARLMVLAWGVGLPCGVLVARFFKVWPGQDWPRELDRPTWWRIHLLGQIASLVLAVVALALVLAGGPVLTQEKQTVLLRAHTLMGWTVMTLGGLQALGGLLRGSKGGPTAPQMRGDHFDMTPRRVWFERLHKSLGWLAILLAQLTIFMGLVTVDAPRWMVLTLATWWFVLLALFAGWQRQQRCIDTYQAIWGRTPDLPGLKRPPIGWGIKRYPVDPAP